MYVTTYEKNGFIQKKISCPVYVIPPLHKGPNTLLKVELPLNLLSIANFRIPK